MPGLAIAVRSMIAFFCALRERLAAQVHARERGERLLLGLRAAELVLEL